MAKKKPSATRRRAELADPEITATVCKLFLEGQKAQSISKTLLQEYRVEISREQVYSRIHDAVRRGWLRFVPPSDNPLSKRIQEDYPSLDAVTVVQGTNEDLSFRSAEMLFKLVCQRTRAPYSQQTVHIGWAGGNAMRRVACEFAKLLTEPSTNLPDRIVCHALVAGFDVNMPMNDPNAFFTYFERDDLTVDVEYVGLHAPAVVLRSQIDKVKDLPVISDAVAQVGKVDIVCTSAAVIKDEHSMLQRYFRHIERNDQVFQEHNCSGDMLWQPLGNDGPLAWPNSKYQSLTILYLEDLPKLISGGGKVLLSLGPCWQCRNPKTEILRSILNQKKQLITHLVTDSRTASGLYRG